MPLKNHIVKNLFLLDVAKNKIFFYMPHIPKITRGQNIENSELLLRASILSYKIKRRASSRYGATNLSVAIWRLLVLSPSTNNRKDTKTQASLISCLSCCPTFLFISLFKWILCSKLIYDSTSFIYCTFTFFDKHCNCFCNFIHILCIHATRCNSWCTKT